MNIDEQIKALKQARRTALEDACRVVDALLLSDCKPIYCLRAIKALMERDDG